MDELGQLNLKGDVERTYSIGNAAGCHHRPHPMWSWRCCKCDCVLCTTCGKDLDSCSCSKAARP